MDTILPFDLEHHTVSMDPGAHYHTSRWAGCCYTGRLTDKKIAKYQREGYYSPEFKAARREIMKNREFKRRMRQGNFDEVEDGRLIYRP